ncbi:LysR family transcriptional regulator [Priestia abyssalis]|uniref:LysR family transcriptional regulator n=1 Tax=Priestia abyssalis TaxID=1221450 RepID=UPI000994B770|nr:LysR family transcriptional regulator [Priestia abyssalis]
MDIRDLRHFMEVADQKNFTKASSAIHLSQPALSKAVKRLEEELDAELFDRSGRELKLTDAGKIVYNQGVKVFSTLQDLTALLDDLMNLPTGEIKIGIPPLIGTLLFPLIAKEFHEQYPNITLELVEHGAKHITAAVEDGKVDLGIIVLPADHQKFSVYPFITEEFVLYVNMNHPLANRDSVSLHELHDEKFILFSNSFALHDRIIQECRNAGFDPAISYKSSQWDLIIELVSAELGITILPKSIYNKLNHANIKAIPFVDTIPMWELGIITKKDGYVSFAVKKLLEFLISIDKIRP